MNEKVKPFKGENVLFKVIEFPSDISILCFPINRNLNYDSLDSKFLIFKEKFKETINNSLLLNTKRNRKSLNNKSRPEYTKGFKFKSFLNPNRNDIIEKVLLKNKITEKGLIIDRIKSLLFLKQFYNKIINHKSITGLEFNMLENHGNVRDSFTRISQTNILPKKIKSILEISDDDNDPREYHHLFYNYIKMNCEECESKTNNLILDIVNICPIFGINVNLPIINVKNQFWDNLINKFNYK